MVLHKAYMPRVLIETGFVSNPVEGAILDSEEGQNDIANAIAQAIISYKKEYFGNGDGYSDDNRPSKKITDKPSTNSTVPTKKETVKAEEVNKKDIKKEISNESGFVYKVQIAASSKKMDLDPSNFKGLKNIEIEDTGSINKYFYGATSDYEEAKKYLTEAKSKGYNSAFIIALKNGKLIPLKDAVK
jgi:N-acetylmuramoyl-L-alanine amidase